MAEPNYWQRLSRKRLSRRALLGVGATTALGGAAALAVGCSGGNGSSPGTTPDPNATPGPGGSITWGRPVSVGGIDPHVDLTGLDITTLLYPSLYSWAPGAELMIFNNLATALEMPEVTNFIFTLREGVRNAPVGGDHDGEDIDSEACKESFFRRGTSITAIDKRFPFKIAGSSDPAILRAALLTPDKYTFSFNMAEPFVPAVREMANATYAIMSPGVVEDAPRLQLGQNAFGSGPFMLEEFLGNERVVLKRNPDYFIPDRPYLDGITYVIITDNASLLAAFKNGQHDISGAILVREDFDRFDADPSISVNRAPSLFYPVVHLNVRREPFDDIRVREALNISINRDRIIELAQSGEGQYSGPIQWPQVKWALPEGRLNSFYKRDVAKAKQLMEAAGYADGIRDILIKTPRLPGINFINDIARIIVDSWKDINVNVQIDEVELGAYIGSVLLPGNFDMTFFPNLPYDEPDRPLSFYHSLGVTGSGNWTGYSNPTLDKLINAQSAEFDVEARQAIITEAQELILEEHGPQLTTTGGYQYSATRAYVHFPFASFGFSLDANIPLDSNPFGTDIWTEMT
ncbi:MAG: ABC transporter substrate-binding protein [Chloroflexi bacterium]|nr:ABC transporter substrate-binding protein [Chloroflexota bacterium]